MSDQVKVEMMDGTVVAVQIGALSANESRGFSVCSTSAYEPRDRHRPVYRAMFECSYCRSKYEARPNGEVRCPSCGAGSSQERML